METTKKTSKQVAAEILATANRLGFKVQATSEVMTITRTFTPGDRDAFVECDMMFFEVLGKLPRTQAGSDWGTDGSGIGGMVAHKNGVFKMHRSGGSKRVLGALRKLVA